MNGMYIYIKEGERRKMRGSLCEGNESNMRKAGSHVICEGSPEKIRNTKRGTVNIM